MIYTQARLYTFCHSRMPRLYVNVFSMKLKSLCGPNTTANVIHKNAKSKKKEKKACV